MIQSYPDFTPEQINAIHSLHGLLLAKCSGVYTVTNLDESRSQIWSRIFLPILTPTNRLPLVKTIGDDTSPPRSTNGNQAHESASESESITLSEVACNLIDALSDLDKLLPPFKKPPQKRRTSLW
ncbi:hypothetical protein M378DRAFT_168399 [Amanita muscaria Koide BX008]|uniref:Uncharacterized protein n=1 Tax=Amanita muscaria (strain Koide BX008) TaxID=946122 RepID=A0A0C2WUV9_AMAMK|nr:hypothetical protein M378DRAFT_171395 [Amanita muscaria Koide BX008]KIL60128.1 hypothetical protein M378DRAFT_168399 [Amanita muscaria Koide BX008]